MCILFNAITKNNVEAANYPFATISPNVGTVTVNESLLTGESDNIVKNVGDVVYSGSFVVSGSCYIRADKVGEDSYAATLSNKARKFRRAKSEILKSLKGLFRIIGTFVVVFGIIMVIRLTIQLFNGAITEETVGDKMRGLLTSLVSMIPSGMFLLTSVALSVGVINLSKKRVLVQEMYCIESLARVDTLCLDKTGTITKGSFAVEDIHPNVISKEELLEIAALVESSSTHPVAESIVNTYKVVSGDTLYGIAKKFNISIKIY